MTTEKVIENYTHYLSVNDGYGDVVYESRNNLGASWLIQNVEVEKIKYLRVHED